MISWWVSISPVRKEIMKLKNVKILQFFEHIGWGNGYVSVPEGHPFFGMKMEELDSLVEVHGGVTFTGLGKELLNAPNSWNDKWVIGFDTYHTLDSIETWTKRRVIDETLNLKKQCVAVDKETKKLINDI